MVLCEPQDAKDGGAAAHCPCLLLLESICYVSPVQKNTELTEIQGVVSIGFVLHFLHNTVKWQT